MKNWLWALWQGLTPCDKELPNAALCKWREIGQFGAVRCDAMSNTCKAGFDTPRCRRLYEKKP